jgi:spoIIIJ-associated protein
MGCFFAGNVEYLSQSEMRYATMDSWEPTIKELVERIGFRDYRLEIVPEQDRGSLFIYENEAWMREHLPMIVEALNHVLQMIAKKNQSKPVFLDINNYRQERENLIAELARAAAKKVHQTKEEVSLPAMNSYERRLVHVELALHPEVKTESVGEGKERYVIIKPI